MPSLAHQKNHNVADDALRGYTRDPQVEAEFARLSNLSAQRLLASFDALGDQSNGRVREETLVCLVRAALRAGNDDLAWKILELLGKRVSRKLARMTKAWRLDLSVSEEISDEMLVALYQNILDLGQSAKFWEVRFWICFDRRFLSLMRRRREEEDRHLAAQEDEETGMIVDPSEAMPDPATVGARLQNPATRSLLTDALAQLPEPIRAAYLMKHWCGYPEESHDPAQTETIASQLGITGRTVRNYLSRAERLLSQWRSETGSEMGRRSPAWTSVGAEY